MKFVHFEKEMGDVKDKPSNGLLTAA